MSSHTHMHRRHAVTTKACVTCAADTYQHCDVSLYISPWDCRSIHQRPRSSRPTSTRFSFPPSVCLMVSEQFLSHSQDAPYVIMCTLRTNQSKTSLYSGCFCKKKKKKKLFLSFRKQMLFKLMSNITGKKQKLVAYMDAIMLPSCFVLTNDIMQ